MADRSTRRLVAVAAGTLTVLVGLLCGPVAALEGQVVEVAGGEDVLAQLKPPATDAERQMYAEVLAENCSAETKATRVRQFIATRQYCRWLKSKFPKAGVPSTEEAKKCSQPPEDVSWDFILDDDEGRAVYVIKLHAPK
jgi:hypothetical protein